MELRIEPCLVELRRELNKTDLCARVYAGRIILSTSPRPASPETPEQLEGRLTMRRAGTAWRALSREAQLAWNDYAGRISRADPARRTRVLTGYQLFLQAASNRLMLGLEAPGEPPWAAPPPAPAGLTLRATSEPRRFEFELRESPGPDPNLRLATRISRPMDSNGRAPNPHICRLIRGFSPDSAPPPPAPGQAIVFENARYAIVPGQRFGLAIRCLRVSDGLYGPELFCDLVRE